MGCCAQRYCLAWPEEKADHVRPPQATAPVPLAHRCNASPSQARRQTRPQAAGVVLPVPTGSSVLVDGCGLGSLRRARASEWLRLWRSSVAGVVCEPALALRRTHVAGGVSPSGRARSRRGRAAPPPAPWAWGRAAGSGGCGPGSRQRRAPGTPGRQRAAGRWCRARRCHTPSLRVPGACQPLSPTAYRRLRHPAARVVPAWVAAVSHRDAWVPASVSSTPTRACRRRWIASAPASLRLSTAPDA